MKILIIDNSAISVRNNSYFVYKTTGEFGSQLKKLGHQCEFFQLSKFTKSTLSNYELQLHGLFMSSARIFKSKFFTYLVAYIKGMQRILRSDFVYIFYPNTFSFLAFFALLVGKRYGLYIRGESGLLTKKSKMLYKNASVIFTVSYAFTDKVNSLFVRPKAYTIRPMIGFSDRDIVSDRCYSKTNGFKILFLGRIDKQKGVFELLEAVSALKSMVETKFQLDIVGGGSYFDEVKLTAERLGISDIVNFRGPINDLDAIRNAYCNSDIYILPSYHEGFPRTLYEAMIFGVPIVTTFVGGISSLMVDRFNCFKIEPKSAKSIELVLQQLMENYPEASKVALNALETVRPIVHHRRLGHAAQLDQILQSYVKEI